MASGHRTRLGQVVTGDRSNTFVGNTGFGYGDTDRVALTEQLTAIFADEVGQDDTVGQAWVDAKQRMLSEILVLDAYQEKSLQQFVLYGLPMFRVGRPTARRRGIAAAPPVAPLEPLAPDTDPHTGQPIADGRVPTAAPDRADPTVPQFDRVDRAQRLVLRGRWPHPERERPPDPTAVRRRTYHAFDGLEARDALITDLTSVDVDRAFDPLFFWASPNFGGPRPEYFDGSFPAEMAAVRSYRPRAIHASRC